MSASANPIVAQRSQQLAGRLSATSLADFAACDVNGAEAIAAMLWDIADEAVQSAWVLDERDDPIALLALMPTESELSTVCVYADAFERRAGVTELVRAVLTAAAALHGKRVVCYSRELHPRSKEWLSRLGFERAANGGRWIFKGGAHVPG